MAQYIIYTYQFSPIVTNQKELFDDTRETSAEIMSKKQDIFGDLFKNDISFKNKKNEYSHRILYNQDNIIVFRLANKKYQNLEENFCIRKHAYSPSCLIIIDNRKDIQHIAIELDTIAFQDTQTVANILKQTFSRYLEEHKLRLEIQKEFQVSEFWNLVEKYPRGISMVRFKFSYPNLPRVSSAIDKMIREESEATNSQQTVFEFNAATDNILTLSKKNKRLSGLAKASADSGNTITIKAKGVRKFVQTGRTNKSIVIDNLEILLENDLIENATTKIVRELNKIK